MTSDQASLTPNQSDYKKKPYETRKKEVISYKGG